MKRSHLSFLSVSASFAFVLSACAVTTTQPAPVAAPVAPVTTAAPPATPEAPAPTPTPAPPATVTPPATPAPVATTPPAATTPPDEKVDPQYRLCAADSDCVAVEKVGCCHNGHKVAVSSAKKDAYQASFKCDKVRPMCPQYRINDTRVPYCETTSHECSMK